jgi:excisionase family DNA binding protein
LFRTRLIVTSPVEELSVASAVPHDLLTPREVAEVMRVSTMTVYRLIKAGDLPAIRVGKHLRIRGQDVGSFLDARVVHASSPTGARQRRAEGKPWPAA